MAYKKLQLRRGAKSALPTLAVAELGYCTDTKELYIGNGNDNTRIQTENDIELPIVSASDNGKSLVVENGTWIKKKIEFPEFTSIVVPKGRIKGDVNGDGVVSLIDYDIVQKVGIGFMQLDEISEWCGDINNDGSVNAADAGQISRYLAGMQSILTQNPTFADYYNNWQYLKIDNSTGVFYTDFSIQGMTAQKTAVVTVGEGDYTTETFVGAECLNGALRLYAKFPPLGECNAIVEWGDGDGSTKVITHSARNVPSETLVLLSPDGGVSEGGSVYYDVSVPNMKPYDVPIITPIITRDSAYTNSAEAVQDWNSKLYFAEPGEGTIRFWLASALEQFVRLTIVIL